MTCFNHYDLKIDKNETIFKEELNITKSFFKENTNLKKILQKKKCPSQKIYTNFTTMYKKIQNKIKYFEIKNEIIFLIKIYSSKQNLSNFGKN